MRAQTIFLGISWNVMIHCAARHPASHALRRSIWGLSKNPASSYSLLLHLVLCLLSVEHPIPKERFSMEWTTPQHEEIDLNCEVSSYANAEL